MTGSIARCLSCLHESLRALFIRVNKEDGLYDQCPHCGSTDVDVYSEDGYKVECEVEDAMLHWP